MYSFFNPGDKICRGLLEKRLPNCRRNRFPVLQKVSMPHLSNNRGFVTDVCISLEETGNDCRMPRSILLEDLNKRIITGNG